MDTTHFEKQIGIAFKDKKLLQQAFIHRSYVNEYKGDDIEHNERLEYLGDAVLELVVTEYLFNTYTEKAEGELTAIRSALVNTMMLSDVADKLRMNEYLMLSKGEAKDTGRARQYILANTFEAFVGSLYLDQGYDASKAFLAEHILVRAEEVVEERLWLDAKSHFQEKSQEHAGVTPTYDVVDSEGPDHDKTFVVGVYLGGEKVAEGRGNSKQEAEQMAARNALETKGW